MPALIITGDDFGVNHAVNEAVEAQYLAGRLSQASLMIHGSDADEALRIARRNPGLCVGLHLTLCAAKRPEPTVLTDSAGNFEPSPALAGWRYFWRKDLHADLQREIAEQFARFLGCGLPAVYWDGHTHLHLHPTILRATLPVAQEHGFRATRLMGNSSRHLIGGVFNWLSSRAAQSLAEAGIRFADQTYGLRETGKMDDASFRERQSDSRRFPVSEIYYHPGVDGPTNGQPMHALTNWRRLTENGANVDSPDPSV